MTFSFRVILPLLRHYVITYYIVCLSFQGSQAKFSISGLLIAMGKPIRNSYWHSETWLDTDCLLVSQSSNVNEVIRAVLNSLFFFFYKKISHASKAPKAPKAPKSTKTQPSKSTKRYKRTKKILKNVLKKHLSGKKSLISLFAFLCLRRKKIEKYLQCKCTKNTDVLTIRFM